jgi:DNA-binding GntR family transcriptional regulator
MADAIDKRSETPSYEQLAAILRGQIADRVFDKQDGQLPSVDKLREKYKLSIDTVTHAIQLLKDEGLVVAVKGRGTYVR